MAGLPPAPLRPLGAAEILDGAVRLVRRNLRAVLTVSVPYAVVATVATALLQYGTLSAQDAATLSALGGLLVTACLGTVLTGLLSPLYAADLLGVPIGAAESARRVGPRGWALLPLGLAIVIAEAAGLVALLFGGIWLWGLWAVAAPAFALERVGIRRALGRSVELARGTFWRVWGLRALGWVLTSVLAELIVLPFQALAGAVSSVDPLHPASSSGSTGLYVTVLAVGQLISVALLAPVSAAVEVLLYTDLRMRKEGMDIVLALPEVPEAALAGPPVTAW